MFFNERYIAEPEPIEEIIIESAPELNGALLAWRVATAPLGVPDEEGAILSVTGVLEWRRT